MRRTFTFLLCSLFLHIGLAHAQDNTAIVAQVKAELQLQGAVLSGACGAFKITNEVARRTGLKLLNKNGGNRAVPQPNGTCLTGEETTQPGYATDYIISLPLGVGYDILGDGGGANSPQWAGPEDAPDMVARNLQNWREPVVLGPGPVVPGPTPGPTPLPGNDISQRLTNIELTTSELFKRMVEHEAAEAAERAKAEEFRQAVGHEYQRFFTFVGKYVLPIVGGIFAGMQVAK